MKKIIIIIIFIIIIIIIIIITVKPQPWVVVWKSYYLRLAFGRE